MLFHWKIPISIVGESSLRKVRNIPVLYYLFICIQDFPLLHELYILYFTVFCCILLFFTVFYCIYCMYGTGSKSVRTIIHISISKRKDVNEQSKRVFFKCSKMTLLRQLLDRLLGLRIVLLSCHVNRCHGPSMEVHSCVRNEKRARTQTAGSCTRGE